MLKGSLEKSLVEHCSPVLAGMKAANLVNYSEKNCREIQDFLEKEGKELLKKGISLSVLREKNEKVLLYVYRKEMLEELLSAEETREFLEECGYGSTEVGESLEKLAGRLNEKEDFPHEIGVFLGYPLGDVKGFIENRGRNCKCTGCWKVYCDECRAKETFRKFEQCRQLLMSRFLAGSSVVQLAAG